MPGASCRFPGHAGNVAGCSSEEVIPEFNYGPLHREGFLLHGRIVFLGGGQLSTDVDYRMLGTFLYLGLLPGRHPRHRF